MITAQDYYGRYLDHFDLGDTPENRKFFLDYVDNHVSVEYQGKKAVLEEEDGDGPFEMTIEEYEKIYDEEEKS